jgi:hypothetical protein
LFRQFFADKNSLLLSFRVNPPPQVDPACLKNRTHPDLPVFPARKIKILNILVMHNKKNRPAPWAVKMLFFRVQQMERF